MEKIGGLFMTPTQNKKKKKKGGPHSKEDSRETVNDRIDRQGGESPKVGVRERTRIQRKNAKNGRARKDALKGDWTDERAEKITPHPEGTEGQGSGRATTRKMPGGGDIFTKRKDEKTFWAEGLADTKEGKKNEKR